MYHHSESMVYMLEDMQRNTMQMEKEVKMMLEQEGRAYGIELDRRKSAGDLLAELKDAIAASETNDANMTWAYIPEEMCNYDCAMPEDYMPHPNTEMPMDMPMEDEMPMDMPMKDPQPMDEPEQMEMPMDEHPNEDMPMEDPQPMEDPENPNDTTQ